MKEEEDQTLLKALLAQRLADAKDLREFFKQAHYANLDGKTGLLCKVSAEEKFLEKVNDKLPKLKVDIVAEKGRCWIKVVSRSPKGIASDWVTGNGKNIFEQADDYLLMASALKQVERPRIVFIFCSGITDKMAEKLERKGIEVRGKRFPQDSIMRLSEDFEEELEQDDTMGFENEEKNNNVIVNLDVSAVFVLISNLTHQGGCDKELISALLTLQAKDERVKKAREQLLADIGDREMIITRTAYKAVQDILSTVAGPQEKVRAEDLFRRVRIVEDDISSRVANLHATERISERCKIIFGTGDTYKAITATANKHCVSSAMSQGVSLDVIIHPSRALSEKKEMSCPEKRAVYIDCKQGAIRAIRFNTDGNYCLTAGSDKTVKLWNPYKSSLLKTYTGTGNEIFDVAASSDNSQIVVGGADKAVTVIDVESGKQLRRWRSHGAKVNCVAFNEESNMCFSGSMDNTMQCFDNRSRTDRPIQIFNEANDSILSIDVNGHEILVGSADCNYRIYNIRDGTMTIDFMGESVNCVHFTPDGNCVLASTQDGIVRLMDKSNGKNLATYKGHANTEYKIESCNLFSMEEVATGSEDGFVYIYSLIDCNVITKLEHPSKVVHSLSAHPKKQHLLTAAGQMAFLWVPKNEELFS